MSRGEISELAGGARDCSAQQAGNGKVAVQPQRHAVQHACARGQDERIGPNRLMFQ